MFVEDMPQTDSNSEYMEKRHGDHDDVFWGSLVYHFSYMWQGYNCRPVGMALAKYH